MLSLFSVRTLNFPLCDVCRSAYMYMRMYRNKRATREATKRDEKRERMRNGDNDDDDGCGRLFYFCFFFPLSVTRARSA